MEFWCGDVGDFCVWTCAVPTHGAKGRGGCGGQGIPHGVPRHMPQGLCAVCVCVCVVVHDVYSISMYIYIYVSAFVCLFLHTLDCFCLFFLMKCKSSCTDSIDPLFYTL